MAALSQAPFHATLRRRRTITIVAVAALSVALSAGPAAAQAQGDQDGPLVVLTGGASVGPDENVDTVVVFDGPATIDGSVNGAVIAFNGDVIVRGTVEEAVVAFNGRVIVEGGATVRGDVVSSRSPQVASDANVEGEVKRENFAGSFREIGLLLWFTWWLVLSISLLILGLLVLLLAPRVIPAAAEAARTSVGPVIGWGLFMVIGLPIASVAVFFTLVAVPLGLIGLSSLGLLYGLGYVTASYLLGRRLIREPQSAYVAFLVGLLLLRAADLIPIVGSIVTVVATILGLGALTVAAWRAAHKPAVAPVTPPVGLAGG